MLILCEGPDTCRALERAQELERHFRTKYDSRGLSVEVLSSGSSAIDELLSHMQTRSLFATRRFFRARDLLGGVPVGRRDRFAALLDQNSDEVIVVSVESEPLSDAWVTWCSKRTKCIRYPFPLLKGRAFEAWVMDRARALHIDEQDRVRELAQMTEGDTWMAKQELMKLSCGGEITQRSTEGTPYEVIDRLVRGDDSALSSIRDGQQAAEILPLLVSQWRSMLRVRDGAAQGVHPYLVRRLRTITPHQNWDEKCARAIDALMRSRQGFGDAGEAAILLTG